MHAQNTKRFFYLLHLQKASVVGKVILDSGFVRWFRRHFDSRSRSALYIRPLGTKRHKTRPVLFANEKEGQRREQHM